MYNYVIIDDENIIRKGTVKKLQGIADKVACIGEASDGSTGLSLIEELKPDFVILDMQMPNMDGMELLPVLSEQYPDLPLLVISGFKNFDYIKQAISANAVEYILKPFSKELITENVLKIIEILETRQDIKGRILDSEQKKEQTYFEYDIKLLTDQMLGFRSGDITLNSSRLSIYNTGYNYELLCIHYNNYVNRPDINEWLIEHDLSELTIYIEPEEPELGLLLMLFPSDFSVEKYRVTRPIIKPLIQLGMEKDIIMSMGLSEVHRRLTDLGTAFSEAAAALNTHLLSDKVSSVTNYTSDITPSVLDWDKQDEFLFRLEEGKKDEVLTLITGLFDMYGNNPSARLLDLKYHCRMLTDECNTILNYYMGGKDQIQSSTSMQQIVDNMYGLPELQDYYLTFFLNLTMLLKDRSVYSTGDNIDKIKAYIQRNYQKNITQELLSSFFYINRSYLSTLFKERTGEKFVDYLNTVRIEKSKELLVNSNLKMYQIAKKVGYDNVKYFFRIFKKKTGKTPEEYKSSGLL